MSCISLKKRRIGGCKANALRIGMPQLLTSQVCEPSIINNYLFTSDNLLVDKNNNKFIVRKQN